MPCSLQSHADFEAQYAYSRGFGLFLHCEARKESEETVILWSHFLLEDFAQASEKVFFHWLLTHPSTHCFGFFLSSLIDVSLGKSFSELQIAAFVTHTYGSFKTYC